MSKEHLAAEYFGQRQIIDALEAVVTEPEIDLAVVRDVLTNPAALLWLGESSLVDDTDGRLYQEIPALREADAMARDYWRENGYRGMTIAGGIGLDSLRTTGVDPHADIALEPGGTNEPGWPVEAVAMGSLCLFGNRVFAAEKLPDRFVTPNGGFDYDSYSEHPAVRVAGDRGDTLVAWPRTETHVGAGDLVLFAHHPVVTVHAARQKRGMSAARLLSWQAAYPAAP